MLFRRMRYETERVVKLLKIENTAVVVVIVKKVIAEEVHIFAVDVSLFNLCWRSHIVRTFNILEMTTFCVVVILIYECDISTEEHPIIIM